MLERSAAYVHKRALRPLLPVAAPVRYAGIPIGVSRRRGDTVLPSVARLYRDVPGYEATLVAGLKRHLRPGDEVVVVGGGWGVTATTAALETTPHGRVTCFEGDAEGCERVRRTAAANGVSGRVSVIHAVVGEAISVYGSQTGPVVAPGSLPDCDVLQLDCEGAELNILREMSIRPRVVLVETHGIFGASTAAVGERLRELEYETTDLGVAEPQVESYCSQNDIHVVCGTAPDRSA